MDKIVEILGKYHGNIAVYIYDSVTKKTKLAPKSLFVRESKFMFEELDRLLGEENVKLMEEVIDESK